MELPIPLRAMANVLHDERLAIQQNCEDHDKAMTMWATVCVQEAILIWRSKHPDLEREMFVHYLRQAK